MENNKKGSLFKCIDDLIGLFIGIVGLIHMFIGVIILMFIVFPLFFLLPMRINCSPIKNFLDWKYKFSQYIGELKGIFEAFGVKK